MWYIDTIDYYGAIKNSKIMLSAATWRDLAIYTKCSKSDRESQIAYDIAYKWDFFFK